MDRAPDTPDDDGAPRGPEQPQQNSQPPLWRTLWAKAGLDLPTVLTMAKGGLPPTIMTAALQSTPAAKTYGTLGYLVTIIAALSLCVLPRAKLVQACILNALAICLAAATSLFAMWTASCARANAPTSNPAQPYNPSAAAIAGFWFFVNIYAANTFRARAPALAFPVIFYTIFVSVLYTTAGPVYTLPQTIKLVVLLLKAFMTGIALALATGLLVLPLNQRDVWSKVAAGYLNASQGLLVEQKRFLQAHEVVADDKAGEETKQEKQPLEAVQKLHSDLFTKLSAELPMAKREFALGNFSTKELGEVYRLLRATVLPLQGMTVILDIFARMNEPESPLNDWQRTAKTREHMALVMRTLHDPYEKLVAATSDGLEHVLLVLKYKTPPQTPASASTTATPNGKTENDEEGAAALAEPGTAGFADRLQASIDAFYATRTDGLQQFFEAPASPGNSDSDNDDEDASPRSGDASADAEQRTHARVERQRRQLYLVLFMEYLLFSSARAVHDLVRFADGKASAGVVARRRLVYPTPKRLRKWVGAALDGSASADDALADVGDLGACGSSSSSGACAWPAFPRADPEHLPASNALQRLGCVLARAGAVLGGRESGFGVRVALATLVVALPAFFRTSHAWFVEHRGMWASIIIAIGMSPTSGASILGFVGRVLGTAVALCFALVNWFVVDARTPGIVVVLWFFVAVYYYFIIKYPQLIQVTLTSMITHVLIIGYELQVRKLGRLAAEATGQPYLTIRAIGPYRVLATLAGIGVGFIFTILPYPTSTRSQIRREVSAAIYLVARYYVNALRIVRMRIDGKEGVAVAVEGGGDGGKAGKSRKGRLAMKEAEKLLTDSLRAYEKVRGEIGWTEWEPSLRGRFPRARYEAVVGCCNNITNYLSITRYASRTFTTAYHPPTPTTTTTSFPSPSSAAWLRSLSTLLHQIAPHTHRVASVLVQLSNGLGNAQPLAPFLAAPAPFRLARELARRDATILAASHLAEPGFVAFAVLQVASAMLAADLKRLVAAVAALVGQVSLDGVGTAEADAAWAAAEGDAADRSSSAGSTIGTDAAASWEELRPAESAREKKHA